LKLGMALSRLEVCEDQRTGPGVWRDYSKFHLGIVQNQEFNCDQHACGSRHVCTRAQGIGANSHGCCAEERQPGMPTKRINIGERGIYPAQRETWRTRWLPKFHRRRLTRPTGEACRTREVTSGRGSAGVRKYAASTSLSASEYLRLQGHS